MTGKMRAAIFEQYGRPFHVTSISRPEPGPGEVLVRIRASGINPLDLKIHEGAAAHARQAPPAILGLDMAGIVESLGPDVSGFKEGDEVYGMVGGVGGIQGTLAEFAAVDSDLLAHKPVNLSFREAAVLPLVVITAWEGLVDRMQVKSGQALLVQGGGGGVGKAAIQLARHFGADVFATGSESSRGVIERAGATFIDSGAAVADYVGRLTGGGFDLAYDTIGGAGLDASFQAVKKFGHVVSALGWGTHLLAPLSFKAASYSGVFTLMPLLTGEGRRHHGEILREAAQLVEAGELSPNISTERFALESAFKAYQAVAGRRSRGKIAVDIG
jgi:NADPH:quinone reductase